MAKDDVYYMRMAQDAAAKSNCKSRQIGAIIVNRYGKIATGYNYTLIDCGDTCPRHDKGYKSGEGLDECPVIHAEMMVIAEAAKRNVSTWDGTMYCWCCEPCKWCAGPIIQAGIKRVVHLDVDPPNNTIHRLGSRLFAASNVELVRIKEEDI